MKHWARWSSLSILFFSMVLLAGCGGRETGPAPEPYNPEELESGGGGAIPSEFADEAGTN